MRKVGTSRSPEGCVCILNFPVLRYTIMVRRYGKQLTPSPHTNTLCSDDEDIRARNRVQLLAAKHKAEEQERELKQKLQSTTARLNGYLNGGRDAGKRTVAGTGGVGGVASAGGPRRVAPAYDRFRDDPVEAAAVSQVRDRSCRQGFALLLATAGCPLDEDSGAQQHMQAVQVPPTFNQHFLCACSA